MVQLMASTMMKLGTVIPWPKKIQKIFESIFATSRNTDIVFWYIISIYFNSSWAL